MGAGAVTSVFGFGLRRAQWREAVAARDQAAAAYRGTVLTAFQAVEDQLATLSGLDGETRSLAAAAAAASRAEQLARDRYAAGTVDQLTVVAAETTALQSRMTLVAARKRQLQAFIALNLNLGGGWTVPAC